MASHSTLLAAKLVFRHHGQIRSLDLAAAAATAALRISTGTTAARTAEVNLLLQYLADRFLRRGFRSN
jgi:hypothetical protein